MPLAMLALSPPQPIDLAAAMSGDVRGDESWSGSTGVIHLRKADAPLVWEEPAVADEATGVYGVDGEPSLIVRLQPWGELVLVEPATGAERTLFPRAQGDYVVGPAFYVPAPIEREVRAERGSDGAVNALVVKVGGETHRLPRIPVRTEEISVERDGVPLAGTLVLPRATGWPVAVLGGGGIWTDRSRVRYAMMLA